MLWWTLAVVLVGGAAVAIHWLSRPLLPEDVTRAAATRPPAASAARGAAAPAASAPAPDLPGTHLDAARLFELGFAGGLVIDQDTRAALEILMADMGDPPSPQDVQRIEDALRKGLPAREAEQAVGLLRNYRAYVAEVEQQMAPRGIPGSVDEMNAWFDQMAAVRQRHFDPAMSDVLFGAHEAYARYSMEVGFIEQDPSLSGPARQERLDRLREQLPDSAKALMPPQTPEMAQLERDIAQARRDGATEAQVEALRQQRLGGRPGG
jgi:lipase chaperone LimK